MGKKLKIFGEDRTNPDYLTLIREHIQIPEKKRH